MATRYQKFIGGLLGEDVEKMSEEERKKLSREGTTSAILGLLGGSGLLGGLGQYGERRQAVREKEAARERARILRETQGGFGRILAGEEGVDQEMAMDQLTGLLATPEGAAALEANPMLKEAVKARMLPETGKLYSAPNIKDFTPESFAVYAQTKDPTVLVPIELAGTPEARNRVELARQEYFDRTGRRLPDPFAGIPQPGVPRAGAVGPQRTGGAGGGGAGGAGGAPSAAGGLGFGGGPFGGLSPQQQREMQAKMLEEETKRVDTVLADTRKMVPQLGEIQKSLDILYSGEAITGIGSQYRKNFQRLQDLVSARPSKAVSDTELLEALLGRDTYGYIQSLGIGARGLDTPAERQFLQSVMSGTGELSRETLIGLAELREKIIRENIENVNSQIQGGDLDWYYGLKSQFGVKKRPFEIKPFERPDAGGKPRSDVRSRADAIIGGG